MLWLGPVSKGIFIIRRTEYSEKHRNYSGLAARIGELCAKWHCRQDNHDKRQTNRHDYGANYGA